MTTNAQTAATNAAAQTAVMAAATAPAAVAAAVAAPAPVVAATAATDDGSTVALALMRRALAVGLTMADADTIITKANKSEVVGQGLIIDMLHAKDPQAGRQQQRPTGGTGGVTVGLDARQKFIQGVELALMAKAQMKGGERNEFCGATLSDIARMSLEHAGVQAPGHDRMVMIGRAFQPRMDGGMASTSDFSNILANVAYKSMMKGYEEAEETFQKWTATGTLPDFKSSKRVDLNLFPSLAVVPEGAEYTMGTLTDRGVTVQLATYGKMFAITRQAIINDDINAFTKIPNRMGRAAIRTIGNLAYAVLTANAAMADSYALFASQHNNLAGSGTVLSTTSLSAGRAKMRLQKDPDSIATGGLNITPAFLIVPVELQPLARQLMLSQYDPFATTLADPNVVQNMAEVIDDARLSAASATAWYLGANPNAFDTIEVDYLNGVSTPVLEQKLGWEVDGIEFKVRMDAGVQALDYRGLYKNPGA